MIKGSFYPREGIGLDNQTSDWAHSQYISGYLVATRRHLIDFPYSSRTWVNTGLSKSPHLKIPSLSVDLCRSLWITQGSCVVVGDFKVCREISTFRRGPFDLVFSFQCRVWQSLRNRQRLFALGACERRHRSEWEFVSWSCWNLWLTPNLRSTVHSFCNASDLFWCQQLSKFRIQVAKYYLTDMFPEDAWLHRSWKVSVSRLFKILKSLSITWGTTHCAQSVSRIFVFRFSKVWQHFCLHLLNAHLNNFQEHSPH